MKELKNESAAAYEDFMAKDPNKFCKAYISTMTKTDIVENNIYRDDVVCPRIRKVLECNKKLTSLCTLKPVVGDTFEAMIKEDRFVVDLVGKHYSCREWDLSSKLCPHACACVNFIRQDPVDYVDKMTGQVNAVNDVRLNEGPSTTGIGVRGGRGALAESGPVAVNIDLAYLGS
ncbi:hypothetical protein GH714_015878 [Hevea brasiliensis]|uniref:SWIM-type domain-containing protein n=1 Tax=Hevea brasiliensis TaxID=3981 RepID=A0A6A6M1I7_HEVBR|nr:hypothetical protein GH714_015878 [Hevea brasiliensis]